MSSPREPRTRKPATRRTSHEPPTRQLSPDGPPLGALDYSARGEKTNIAVSGCGPTALAMVLATWVDPKITPKSECAWALAHGYKAPHQGTYYGYFAPAAKRFGLTCKMLNGVTLYGKPDSPYHAQAKSAVDRGDLVIACMGRGLWTSSGHFVLVWNISGNVVSINDPASTRAVRTKGDYSVFKRQVKYYFVVQRPAAKPAPTPKPKEEEEDMDFDKLFKRTDRRPGLHVVGKGPAPRRKPSRTGLERKRGPLGQGGSDRRHERRRPGAPRQARRAGRRPGPPGAAVTENDQPRKNCRLPSLETAVFYAFFSADGRARRLQKRSPENPVRRGRRWWGRRE
ncbi:MAG: C39 family peptidase [Evtepia sp.]